MTKVNLKRILTLALIVIALFQVNISYATIPSNVLYNEVQSLMEKYGQYEVFEEVNRIVSSSAEWIYISDDSSGNSIYVLSKATKRKVDGVILVSVLFQVDPVTIVLGDKKCDNFKIMVGIDYNKMIYFYDSILYFYGENFLGSSQVKLETRSIDEVPISSLYDAIRTSLSKGTTVIINE